LEIQSKTAAEMTKLIDARIGKLDEHHDRHTEVLDLLRSRMDRLDGAKGLAFALIAVVGALGSIAGWVFGKMWWLDGAQQKEGFHSLDSNYQMDNPGDITDLWVVLDCCDHLVGF
jgi:hypothetical protein